MRIKCARINTFTLRVLSAITVLLKLQWHNLNIFFKVCGLVRGRRVLFFFFGLEKGTCYDMLTICKQPFRKGWLQSQFAGYEDTEESGWEDGGGASLKLLWVLKFCFEPRRPKLIKLGSLSKSQMDRYLTDVMKFSFWSEASTGECFTLEEMESLIRGGGPRRARSPSGSFILTTLPIQ